MKTPKEIQRELSERERRLRKKQKMTLQQLAYIKMTAECGNITEAAEKLFEGSGEISLQSVIKIAFALGCEDDFSAVFANNTPMSIEEIINGEI